MLAKDVTGKYECDDGDQFDASEIELKPFGNNMSITPPPGMTMRFVGADGVIRSGNNPTATDQILHCPKCHKPHLFGFMAVNPK